MRRKCQNCGKWFNTGAFSEEYCPYCGTVLCDNDRKKIRNREYFWKHTFPIIFGCLFFAVIIIICIINLV